MSEPYRPRGIRPPEAIRDPMIDLLEVYGPVGLTARLGGGITRQTVLAVCCGLHVLPGTIAVLEREIPRLLAERQREAS